LKAGGGGGGGEGIRAAKYNRGKKEKPSDYYEEKKREGRSFGDLQYQKKRSPIREIRKVRRRKKKKDHLIFLRKGRGRNSDGTHQRNN